MSALPQPFSGSTIHGGSPALRVLQSVSFGTTQRRQYSPGTADDGTRADARRSQGWDRPKNAICLKSEPGRSGGSGSRRRRRSSQYSQAFLVNLARHAALAMTLPHATVHTKLTESGDSNLRA